MGDRLVSTPDHKLEPEVTTVHRLEVISGTGRRRQFTEDFKARVVEETLVPGAIASDVARQHGSALISYRSAFIAWTRITLR
jgi:transposase